MILLFARSSRLGHGDWSKQTISNEQDLSLYWESTASIHIIDSPHELSEFEGNVQLIHLSPHEGNKSNW